MLSESVARGLKQIKGDEASETIRFVEMMDKLFDCFDVNDYDKGRKKERHSKNRIVLLMMIG